MGLLVPGQSRQKKIAIPHLNGKKLGLVMHPFHSSKGGKHKIEGSWSRVTWAKDHMSKINRTKGADKAQVV
jgi:hypothetical protein